MRLTSEQRQIRSHQRAQVVCRRAVRCATKRQAELRCVEQLTVLARRR